MLYKRSALTTLLFAMSCSAESKLEHDVYALFEAGAWDKALALLEESPNVKSDPVARELLATAYLYTASRLDAIGNFDKARETMKQVVDQGGKARFFVSKARDKKKELYLVDATPGELDVTSGSVEFKPLDASGDPSERWDKKDITSCGLNSKYGKSSNSFHLTLGRGNENNFRPWHFSADESELICSLIGAPAGARSK